LPAPAGAELTAVESAQQMADAVMRLLPEASIIIKAAAVSDYTVAQPADQKLKRRGKLTLELEPTTDIVAEVGRRKRGQIAIGFAAETENILDNARQKLVAKSLDAIVVNDVSREGIGFDSERNAVTILTPSEAITVPESSKWEVAQRVLDCAVELKKHTLASSR
jgi:phosphopantothenoylcysteine decarboxylase/phosphopantothenate--cysteine ligase